MKESIRSKLRVMVELALEKHAYPPAMQEKATRTVLEQAKLIEDCTARSPHSALGMRSPVAYRTVLQPSFLSEQ